MPASYNDFVFINCPFDEAYFPMLRALAFAIYGCGFFPVTALAEDNGTENRLGKIERCVESCRYGIHDISRIELNENGLPRFNMPFELGLFFGAKRFGDKTQKNKNAIILDTTSYRYQQFISDLNGVDIRAHNNNPDTAIRIIRDWLKTSSGRVTIPGHLTLIKEYNTFSKKLPEIVEKLGLDINNILFNDYCLLVEETLQSTL